MERRRFKQDTTLQDRIVEWAKDVRFAGTAATDTNLR